MEKILISTKNEFRNKKTPKIVKKIFIDILMILLNISLLLNIFIIIKNKKFINLFALFNKSMKIIINNKPKIIAISYSNEYYKNQLAFNKRSAIEIGKVSKHYSYGPNDIDKKFKEKNKDILYRNKGNGYWLWKPYFILRTLKEELDYGDYLIYTDATIIYKNDSKVLIDFMNNNNEQILVYRLECRNCIEKYYSKRDSFILMAADLPYYTDTRQYNAAIQIYRKSEFTEKFLEDYLYYSQDKRIITDENNTMGFSNYEGFIDHRHDQTILSILIKKYGLLNSGNTNLNMNELNKLKMEIPFIFCHYRRMEFKDYNDLFKKYELNNF